MKTGILLINLGTPEGPNTSQVRRYLREFLCDPRVLVMPALARYALVNAVIVPFRSPKSAKAYQAIWNERGSPLLFHSLDLRDSLRELLDVPIELAMRYGQPTIASGIEALVAAGCERVLCAPLYPQYATSSTESSIDAIKSVVNKRGGQPTIDLLPAFYADERFLDAFAAVGKPVLKEFEPDHVIFSYHGLPASHLTSIDPSGKHCLASDHCCASIGEFNRHCYRAQCFATTAGLRERLDLEEANTTIAFQSRMGREPWIQPFTDVELLRLPALGVKRLAVFCPAFVADCLETLEEIGIRARADFRAAGGDDLVLVPSLNAEPVWCEGLAEILRERL